MTDLDTTPTGSAERTRSGVSRRQAVVFSVAALVVLLVGAAIGMLFTLSSVGSDSAPAADSVDVGFAHDMRVHHLQAITMAGLARDRTGDEEVRQLAFDIESTQLDQSGQMSGWLTTWDQPILPPPGEPYMRWMPASAGHDHQMAADGSGVTRMPGMATTEELGRLRNSTGAAFDTYFLQLMLRHHVGGLEMAGYAAENARIGYVRNLADKIRAGQQGEADLLTRMITTRGAQPLPRS